MNQPLSKTTRWALMLSGGIDALLGSIVLLIGFHLVPVDVTEFGFESWHAILMGAILFIVGIGVIAYNLSHSEE
jgi:sulfite exporter TauE/SafE